MVDVDVRKRVNVLFRQWAAAYKGVSGLERIAALHKELPRKSRPQPQQSRIVREQDAEAAREREEHSPPAPQHARQPSASSSRPVSLGSTPQPSSSFFKRDKKDKRPKGQKFNLEREKGQMLETIASANVASTNLLNGLQLINREQQRVSDNPEVMQRFETCKTLYIGGLLNANDELVKGLMAFEIMDKSIDDDSDSEDESSTAQTSMASMRIDDTPPAKPPRPTSIPMPPVPTMSKQSVEPEEEDDDDPFGDSNGKQDAAFSFDSIVTCFLAIPTPGTEREEHSWRDV
jgi:hypothetical protein